MIGLVILAPFGAIFLLALCAMAYEGISRAIADATTFCPKCDHRISSHSHRAAIRTPWTTTEYLCDGGSYKDEDGIMRWNGCRCSLSQGEIRVTLALRIAEPGEARTASSPPTKVKP